MNLISRFSPKRFAQALESWDWIGTGGKTPLFTSPFGDVFFRADDGFWWLDTLGATLTQPWATAEELQAALNTREGQDQYLMAELAAGAERQGLLPSLTEVLGFKVPPVLGGEIAVGNIETIDFAVSLDILGQIHRQVHDLPPGTKISRITVDGGDPR